MEYHANPPNSAHATNAQPWNIRTHWEMDKRFGACFMGANHWNQVFLTRKSTAPNRC